MPYHSSIHKEKRLVVSTGSGLVTFEELMANADQLVKHADFDPAFDQLVDATAMTELRVSVDEAKILARLGTFSSDSRRAFVAPGPGAFGMMRLWGAYHSFEKSASQVSIFYDLRSARAWLGVDH